MVFDINKTMDEMFTAMSGKISDKSPEVQNCIKKALNDEKEALINISKARIKNEITDEDVQSHLDDEKIALEGALLACNVKAKEMAQSAAGASMNVLKSAIAAVL